MKMTNYIQFHVTWKHQLLDWMAILFHVLKMLKVKVNPKLMHFCVHPFLTAQIYWVHKCLTWRHIFVSILFTTQKHIAISDMETHFCVHPFWLHRFFECISVWHGDTFLCPSSWLHRFLECTIHRLLITTRKHIPVSDTETCFRFQHRNMFPCPSFWLHRFFEGITHRVHVPTRKHIYVSDTETCFRVLLKVKVTPKVMF